MNIANAIKAGQIDVGIGGGVETMSMFDMKDNGVDASLISSHVFQHSEAHKCLMSMGETSENVAEQFGITRVM